MRTLYTFGDSMLDCSHYNDERVSPGTLLCENRDDLFPEFVGEDLRSVGPVTLAHRARDGAVLHGLRAQYPRKAQPESACAIITIGGNDLLQGLISRPEDQLRAAWNAWMDDFEHAIRECPVPTRLVGTVYDPTFRDPTIEARWGFGSLTELVRARLVAFNAQLAERTLRAGAVPVDIHGLFLSGDPSWVVEEIEPSIRGASEVRRAFLHPLLAWARGA
jgi:acyl-CoA thioesterase-1